eukprot:7103832-Pyramimonas_sp.AAC.1
MYSPSVSKARAEKPPGPSMQTPALSAALPHALRATPPVMPTCPRHPRNEERGRTTQANTKGAGHAGKEPWKCAESGDGGAVRKSP